MAITTAADINNIRVTFRHDFQEGYKSAAAGQWMRIATKVPAVGREGVYGWLGVFPSLQEWTGARPFSNLKEHSYTISNKRWANGVKVNRDTFRDDMNTGIAVYSPFMRMLGESAARFADEQIFDLFKDGLSTACYDGQMFFDTDHPVYANVDGTGANTMTANLKKSTVTGTHTY